MTDSSSRYEVVIGLSLSGIRNIRRVQVKDKWQKMLGYRQILRKFSKEGKLYIKK